MSAMTPDEQGDVWKPLPRLKAYVPPVSEDRERPKFIGNYGRDDIPESLELPKPFSKMTSVPGEYGHPSGHNYALRSKSQGRRGLIL